MLIRRQWPEMLLRQRCPGPRQDQDRKQIDANVIIKAKRKQSVNVRHNTGSIIGHKWAAQKLQSPVNDQNKRAA